MRGEALIEEGAVTLNSLANAMAWSSARFPRFGHELARNRAYREKACRVTFCSVACTQVKENLKTSTTKME
jgi:hypothetical protein